MHTLLTLTAGVLIKSLQITANVINLRVILAPKLISVMLEVSSLLGRSAV
jgi:hypothetical protein